MTNISSDTAEPRRKGNSGSATPRQRRPAWQPQSAAIVPLPRRKGHPKRILSRRSVIPTCLVKYITVANNMERTD
eukprot:6180702-Pleurochrysis_carterae.AAC.1